MTILGKFEPQVYAIVRIVVGFLFMLHGSQKLFNIPANPKGAMPLNALMGFGGVVELVGGLMILIGLFAGIAAFIFCVHMAVAYFIAHQPNGALPLLNGGGEAVLFCFIFLYMAARGSGIWSVDSILKKEPVE